jgi:chromosome segregation ATPase
MNDSISDKDSLEGSCDDHDNVNNLIDFLSTSISTCNNEIELKNLIQKQNQEIKSLKEEIEKLNARCSNQESTVDILRNSVRRLRFAKSELSSNQRSRSDLVFIDNCRRKFLNEWNGQMAYLNDSDALQLSFLAHILSLPGLEEFKE